MKKIFYTMKNELFSIFKDPATILIMVIGVALYAIVYSIPYSGAVLRDINIAVLDYDNSATSRTVTRELDASEYLSVKIKSRDLGEVQENFNKGEILSYVIIPKDFERDLKRGKSSNLALYSDSAYLLIYRSVANGVMTVANTCGAKAEINKLMKKGVPKSLAMAIKQPFELVSIPLFNPSGSYEAYIFPVVLILILQQTMLVGVGLLEGSRRERRETEIADEPVQTVLGKGFAHTLLYLAHSVLYFLVFPFIYGYNLNFNIGALFVFAFIYLMSVSFMAQALSYFFKKRETSLMLLVVTAMPILFAVGFIWPKEAMPPFVNLLAYIFPFTPAADAIVRINQMGASFSQVFPDFLMLLVLCAVYFTLACVRSRLKD